MIKFQVMEGSMKGQNFQLDGDIVFLGRSSKNDVQILDGAVSRMHMKIFKIGGSLFVEDLKSSNGTFVNGEPVAPGEGFQVQTGDIVSVGDTAICLNEISIESAFDFKEVRPSPLVRAGKREDVTEERRQRSHKELELIKNFLEFLGETIDIHEFLKRVPEFLKDTLPRIDRSAVFLFDNKEVAIKDVITQPGQEQTMGQAPFTREVLDQVLKEPKAVMMHNTAQGISTDFSGEEGTGEIRSVMCVPIEVSSKLYGAIYVDGIKDPHAFREEDLLFIECLSGFVGVAVEKARLASKLSSIARILSES